MSEEDALLLAVLRLQESLRWATDYTDTCFAQGCPLVGSLWAVMAGKLAEELAGAEAALGAYRGAGHNVTARREVPSPCRIILLINVQ